MYTHKPISPLMGSEAPCYDGGVSTDYSLHIVSFNTPKSNIFQFFQNLNHPPLIFIH